METGRWLSVVPMELNHMVFSPQEFRDGLALCYHLHPPDFLKDCDGCGWQTSIQHVLGCKKRGLVTSHHNEVRDDLYYLLCQSFPPTATLTEPILVNKPPLKKKKGMTEDNFKDAMKTLEEEVAKAPRGNIASRGFWSHQTTCMVDVCLTDSDQPFWINRLVEKLLGTMEREKKKIYLKICLEARKDFTPFVATVDGVLAWEATAYLTQLAKHLVWTEIWVEGKINWSWCRMF